MVQKARALSSVCFRRCFNLRDSQKLPAMRTGPVHSQNRLRACLYGRLNQFEQILKGCPKLHSKKALAASQEVDGESAGTRKVAFLLKLLHQGFNHNSETLLAIPGDSCRTAWLDADLYHSVNLGYGG